MYYGEQRFLTNNILTARYVGSFETFLSIWGKEKKVSFVSDSAFTLYIITIISYFFQVLSGTVGR